MHGPHGFFAAQGLQGFFAAQGLHGFFAAHGLHGFFAAHGLHGFFAAQGLHGFFAAQGLHGCFAANRGTTHLLDAALPPAQGLHGLHGPHGFFAAHGLHGFFAAHGLHGFFAAHGLHGLRGWHGLCPTNWIIPPIDRDTAGGFRGWVAAPAARAAAIRGKAPAKIIPVPTRTGITVLDFSLVLKDPTTRSPLLTH